MLEILVSLKLRSFLDFEFIEKLRHICRTLPKVNRTLKIGLDKFLDLFKILYFWILDFRKRIIITIRTLFRTPGSLDEKFGINFLNLQNSRIWVYFFQKFSVFFKIVHFFGFWVPKVTRTQQNFQNSKNQNREIFGFFWNFDLKKEIIVIIRTLLRTPGTFNEKFFKLSKFSKWNKIWFFNFFKIIFWHF